MNVKFNATQSVRWKLVLVAVAVLCWQLLSHQSNWKALAGVKRGTPVVHSVTDLSHEFSFYMDGRFAAQYLKGKGVDVRNWATLYKCDFSNVNLLILSSGNTPCPYLPQDIQAVKTFVKAGGGLLILGDYVRCLDGTDYKLNAVAAAFGDKFLNRKAQQPLVAAPFLSAQKVETYKGKTLWLQRPNQWKVLIRDAANRPVLARRRFGKGTVLIASRALAGHRPDAKDPINAQWWTPLLVKAASGKPVDPRKRPRGQLPENITVRQGLTIQYTDYLQPMADLIFNIFSKARPELEKIFGVPPYKKMLTKLILLPTSGGGFSSGSAVGLGVWWGGFPEKRYGMIELIGHECTHSWVLPYSEPMWNEPIATYVGILLAKRLGLRDEADRKLNRYIKNAQKLDPDMKKYDIARGKNVPRAVVWGKTMWIWEQLRKERPDILARYFQAKRCLIRAGSRKQYTPDDCVAVISVAMGRNMFPWFQAHGLDVQPSRTDVPIPTATTQP